MKIKIHAASMEDDKEVDRTLLGSCDFETWATSAALFGIERDPPSEAKVARARAALEQGKEFQDFDDEGSFACSDVTLVLSMEGA